MESFYAHTKDLVDAIEDCAAKMQILPCLTLLYSGMDVMASLDLRASENNRDSFVRWVDAYLLKDSPIECSALDLYAARCGVVHTFTADSRLYQEGRAKKIAYAWGLGSVNNLRRVSDELGYQDWRTVHIGDLVVAFKHGVANHLDHIENDVASKERFLRASGLWFSNLNGDDLTDYLKEIDAK